jgi:hypothetical protein
LKLLLLTTLFVTSLCAQDPAKPETKPGKPEAPKLTTELARDFWKARARQIAAAKEKDDADAQMQATVQKMQAFCGPTAILSGDAQGDPSCLLKESQEPAAK